MSSRKIDPVTDNMDKQRTYREHKGRYKRAMENGFYFEALLIDYALLEDRLRAMLFHMGLLTDRTALRIWKKKSGVLREIVSSYKMKNENDQLSIKNISGKVKIVRCILKWSAYAEAGYQFDRHLSTIKSQCQKLNIDAILSTLDVLEDWCAYRNEVIHGLMNKNLESLTSELAVKADEGMRIANFLDCQVRLLKKENKIRKSANLQT